MKVARAIPFLLLIPLGSWVQGPRLDVRAVPSSVSSAWRAEGNQAFAGFGFSVGTAGDVNGDGFADVVVGAWRYDNGQTNEGRAFVYHGSPSGSSTTPSWTAEGDQATAFFGYSTARAGDVNGDGFGDLIVGAWGHDNGQANEGRAFVYHGSASGLSAGPAWTAESDQVGASFGYTVGSAGDVNGDGFDDVSVGAFAYDNGQTDEGRAFVYHGSASGLGASPAWTAEGDQDGAFFAYSVGTAGDVNGDGFDEAIAGARHFDSGQTDEGVAFVYLGSSAGLSTLPVWTEQGDQALAEFGGSVAAAGDVNGDGFDDVVIGAHLFDNGQTNEGRGFVYHGSPSGLAAVPDWTAESEQASARFSVSVGTAGDVNGDGFDDVVLGADLFDNGQTDEGAIFVYHGSALGLAGSPSGVAEGNQANSSMSTSGGAGDVNGDGFDEVIAGAPNYDNGQRDEGQAVVFRGAPR